MNRIVRFLKTEPVLCVSAAAALLSMLLVPPSPAYWGYLDFRVLSLLFCLMAVVAGLQSAGVFEVLSQRLCLRANGVRALSLILVLLCFFSSMLITNDVALITFVPFAIGVLGLTGQQELLIPVVVLQTVAANLGSMLTPVGNPQNLYLYSFYEMAPGDFFSLTLPLTGLSLLLLVPCCLLGKERHLTISFAAKANVTDRRRALLYGVLALVCLLGVFRLLPYQAALAAVLGCMLLWDRPRFRAVDYGLLCTFVCFFIFVGNLGQLGAVRALVSSLLQGRELPASALISQVVSNVPAAVMLSSFTGDARALLAGTNIGGLGTLIASLASLISFKFYCKTPGARPGKYLLVFTGVNLVFLLILLCCAQLMIS
ncbi:SLC13 family permease [Provencibacterium massiliense]|uniref:SLC13 family permease n=1 Tax=Provencibacterium massiliense TaxID=1841868 RepID=UPI0009A79FE2|nr:SLC13 family permease [Provencibacterium massiliense]RGB67857.1 citrate transporter [Harryflintia acetispora]